MTGRRVSSALLLALASITPPLAAQDGAAPERIELMPVFFVPAGEALPSGSQVATLMAHVQWSRERFHEMLGCRGTFDVSPDGPQVVAGLHPVEVYQRLFETGVPQMTSEILGHFGYGRFDAPHVYLILVMNPAFDFPTGGGRPCNGGYDTGSGIVVMSSFALDHHPNFQSTLQHELGHSFGLPHVDVYGYDMATSASIMSYNPAHHTSFFEPSATPGTLIPEDVRGLAYNDAAFPRLAFDDAIDLPAGYEPAPPVWLGPMLIPGQPANHVAAATGSGEAFGSSVQNVVQGRIRPSAGPGATFDPASMWASDPSDTGWVSVDLAFPVTVELDTVAVHSEHSGQFHRAEHVVVRAEVDEVWIEVADQALPGADALVAFEPAASARWSLDFLAGASDRVVIRGLQFYRDGVEHFPPFIPEPVTPACLHDLDGDGAVAVGDLITLMTTWGDAPIGPADFDCDGRTGISDLVDLLLHWGGCAGAEP